MKKGVTAALTLKSENLLGDDVPQTMKSVLLAYGDSSMAQLIDREGREIAELRLRLDNYDPELKGCHAVISTDQGALIVARIEGENIRNACRQLTNDVVVKNIRQAIKAVITRGKSGDVRLINGRLYPENLLFPPRLSLKDRSDLLVRAKRASSLYSVASIALLSVVAGAVLGHIHIGVLLMTPFFLGTMAALDRRMRLDMLLGTNLGAYQSHYDRAARQHRSIKNAINIARGA